LPDDVVANEAAVVCVVQYMVGMIQAFDSRFVPCVQQLLYSFDKGIN
jgi:hypothetical protein